MKILKALVLITLLGTLPLIALAVGLQASVMLTPPPPCCAPAPPCKCGPRCKCCPGCAPAGNVCGGCCAR